jgi:hypothetical protein
MTKRIMFCPIGLTASLLVAALACGTSWASTSSASISAPHAQVRLAVDFQDPDPGNTGPGDTNHGDTNPGNTEPEDTHPENTEPGNTPSCLRAPCPMNPEPRSCGMDANGMPTPCRRSNDGNNPNPRPICERGLKLMTIDVMLRSVAAPGRARELKAADANRDNHLCVKLTTNGRTMARFVDNNRAV